MLDYLSRKKSDSLFKTNKRKRKFLNYKDTRKVIILFNIQDWEEIQQIVKDLEQENKNVIAWTVKPKNSPDVSLPHNIRIIDLSKEMTWMKTLSNSVIEEFDKLNYDTLLDLTTTQDDILDILLASNKSTFCIGIKEHEYKAYDFIMLKKENISIFETFRQIKHYLRQIK